MKAIVLTCDKYHEITNHMLETYFDIWPDNNMIFRIPWNKVFPKFIADKWGNKVEFIQTPHQFKPTITNLLAGIDDEEWIYWATDDTYLIKINREAANTARRLVDNLDSFNSGDNDNKNIWSVMFYNGSYDAAFSTINYDQFIDYQGLRFCKKNKITYQWQHQFCRSKVIKTMFDCLDEPEFPKQLDHMQKEEKSKPFWNLIKKGTWLVTEHNQVIMAEPTTRGKLTKNGYESFLKYGLDIPKGFEVSEATIIKK